jgi:Phosphomannose isomerase
MDTLPAPFDTPSGQRIGEIWFEPPAELDSLLVKYIFASEKLSVQVHPSDAQTIAQGIGRQGKEECWLIVAAEADARLGIGFNQNIGPDALRAAALDGSIEHLMSWHPVKPGDFFYIPANTVHAIGAGVSLIEVQQNSDITYRLFDYGRPRELHLEEGMAVARGEPYDMDRWYKCVTERGSQSLVDGPLFVLDRVEGLPSPVTASRYPGALLVIPLKESIEVAGEMIAPGSCALAENLAAVNFPADAVCLITAPSRP